MHVKQPLLLTHRKCVNSNLSFFSLGGISLQSLRRSKNFGGPSPTDHMDGRIYDRKLRSDENWFSIGPLIPENLGTFKIYTWKSLTICADDFWYIFSSFDVFFIFLEPHKYSKIRLIVSFHWEKFPSLLSPLRESPLIDG